jgi:hypothetical protein
MKGSRVASALGGLTVLLVFAGCAQRTPPLYMWEVFPRHQYEVLARAGGSVDEQILKLEAHAEKAKAANAALPPGFRAHLGMLYLKAGNADKAHEFWLAEKQSFPESSPYMDQLLKRLNPSATTAKTESPA